MPNTQARGPSTVGYPQLCVIYTLRRILFNLVYFRWNVVTAGHSSCAVLDKNCLRPLEHWDRGFESHSRHGCLSAFILCMCCPVLISTLRRADPPVQRILATVLGLRNWSETKRFTGALCSKWGQQERKRERTARIKLQVRNTWKRI
jgi:hypothetical protein